MNPHSFDKYPDALFLDCLMPRLTVLLEHSNFILGHLNVAYMGRAEMAQRSPKKHLIRLRTNDTSPRDLPRACSNPVPNPRSGHLEVRKMFPKPPLSNQLGLATSRWASPIGQARISGLSSQNVLAKITGNLDFQGSNFHPARPDLSAISDG